MDSKTNVIHKDVKNFPKTPNLVDYDRIYKDFSWEKADKEIEYFSDGKINIAHNIVDRHTKGKNANKVALHFNGKNGKREQYTFKDLAKTTNKFANVLVANDVRKGDRVFIFLPTIPERYISFVGVLKTGAIVSPMFPAFQEMALLDRLSDSKAKIVVTDCTLFPRIEKIWKDLPHLEKVIVVKRGSDSLPEGKNLVYYEKEMEKASEEFAVVHLNKEDFSYMLYTSGTTGKPKGVMHAHGDILQAMMTTKYVLDVHDDDVYWCTADTGWVTGVVYGVLGIWGLGQTSVINEERFSPEGWYKVIEDYKVTVWYTAPTAIRMLMGSEVNPKSFDLSSLRHLASVGEPLNPEAIWWALEKIGLPFHDTWWQTELGGISITNYPVLDIKPGSMGKPFPGVIAAVVDGKGKEVRTGEEGDLALKPESVSSLMREIWGNKEKYDSYFANGWYLSGDKAYQDKDGYFWFVGRADDIIKTSGERVGPFEVESALVEYPGVVEAGVIGKPDPLRGEIIKAFIVLKLGVKGDDELKAKIAKFVKEHLAGNEYPREIEFIDKLPKTRSGKIMRRLLKAKELGLSKGDTSTLEDY
jgi:acetyl-CoA synthetase